MATGVYNDWLTLKDASDWREHRWAIKPAMGPDWYAFEVRWKHVLEHDGFWPLNEWVKVRDNGKRDGDRRVNLIHTTKGGFGQALGLPPWERRPGQLGEATLRLALGFDMGRQGVLYVRGQGVLLAATTLFPGLRRKPSGG